MDIKKSFKNIEAQKILKSILVKIECNICYAISIVHDGKILPSVETRI